MGIIDTLSACHVGTDVGNCITGSELRFKLGYEYKFTHDEIQP